MERDSSGWIEPNFSIILEQWKEESFLLDGFYSRPLPFSIPRCCPLLGIKPGTLTSHVAGLRMMPSRELVLINLQERLPSETETCPEHHDWLPSSSGTCGIFPEWSVRSDDDSLSRRRALHPTLVFVMSCHSSRTFGFSHLPPPLSVPRVHSDPVQSNIAPYWREANVLF